MPNSTAYVAYIQASTAAYFTSPPFHSKKQARS